ncbi:flagellar motor switch protein FliG [Candidatus Sumerlaeota bacterium]|nr:flagellar motor switch protein FliG [Candidatus Sumerlaeota bacterium]
MAKSRVERPLTGPEKAVIMLLSMQEDVAQEIIQGLDTSELTKISNYVNLLDEVPREKVKAVKREFGDRMLTLTGGLGSTSRNRMRMLMESSLPQDKLGGVIDVLDSGDSNIGLETLKWLDPHSIAAFIKNEHPQTIALILAHLDPMQSAQVLGLLNDAMQTEIVLRVANLDRINPEIVRELNAILARELNASDAGTNRKVGGVEAVAEIMNSLDKTSETRILGKIEEENPSLAETIRELMFVFEDLLKVDDRSMQSIMKEVSNDVLTLSLKTASPQMKEKLFKSISSRAATMIEEELEVMGPVKLSDVEAAQNEIVKIARRLEEEGKIVLSSGGGEHLV